MAKVFYADDCSWNLYQAITHDYFHGDFDLKSLLKEIGVEESKKIFKQFLEENDAEYATTRKSTRTPS